ncbi:adenosine receptor A2a-like [Nematostella vectensis]|uniref:adenosine receptor A2a-like n=1 Tax=Nematostella vectensis TaxID=45351 RepID=UPI0020777BB3|nr:adenosine receptor A2a-like [Nematostella vectensis]
MHTNNTSCILSHEPLGDSSHVGNWYWSVRWAISLVIVLVNGLVILAIMLRRRLRMTTNWFILSLATADLSIGAIVMPSGYILCTPPFEMRLFSRLLLITNSAANPFVYALIKRDIRREIKELLTCWCRLSRGSSVGALDSRISTRGRTPLLAVASATQPNADHAEETQVQDVNKT